MAAVVTPEDQACLDEHGYCVIKSVVDEAVATSIRSLVDDLLGPEPRETIDAAALGYQTYETLKSHGALANDERKYRPAYVLLTR